MALIRLTEVHRTYTAGLGQPVHALRGITAELHAGEFVAITGPSGSGKSTFLRVLGTIDRPTKGKYIFKNQNLADWSDLSLSRLRAEEIGFVFQNFNLMEHLTVFQNIKLGLKYRRQKLADSDARILSAMDQVGLGHRADHLPHQLSGGQQQRCAIARAIVGAPSLILADEPTGNLDTENAKQVLNLLRDLNDRGTTVVIVTHSKSQADIASRLIELRDGQINLISRRRL